MEINHNLLLQLGFSSIPNRPFRYTYKGVTGRLFDEAGTFHFHGFNPPINLVSDLRYMMMIIDYNYQATMEPYPNHYN